MSESVLDRALAGKNVKVRPLAEAVGMSVNGLHLACRRGDVKTITIGSSIFVPASEVLRLLGRMPGSEEPAGANRWRY
jgi:hypothetical protein